MKKTKKKSTQTDESGGEKMSVKDQQQKLLKHIETKSRIAHMEEKLQELYESTKSLDPYDEPCDIDMHIRHIEEELCKEYAKLRLSMNEIPSEEKEKWK